MPLPPVAPAQRESCLCLESSYSRSTNNQHCCPVHHHHHHALLLHISPDAPTRERPMSASKESRSVLMSASIWRLAASAASSRKAADDDGPVAGWCGPPPPPDMACSAPAPAPATARYGDAKGGARSLALPRARERRLCCSRQAKLVPPATDAHACMKQHRISSRNVQVKACGQWLWPCRTTRHLFLSPSAFFSSGCAVRGVRPAAIGNRQVMAGSSNKVASHVRAH